MNYIKHKVLHFVKETNISKVPITLQVLKAAAQRKGYLVKSYSASGTHMIILGIYDEAKKAASVSAIDSDGNTIVFIDDSMPQDKQLFALAHEIGHIELSHGLRTPGSVQENEANKFAHYLLFYNQNTHAAKPSVLIPVIAILCIICILLLSVLQKNRSAVADTIVQSSSYPEERLDKNNYTAQIYYWTKSGRVYHLYSDCQSLKNSKNILSGNCAEARKAKERLCKFCEKRK